MKFSLLFVLGSGMVKEIEVFQPSPLDKTLFRLAFVQGVTEQTIEKAKEVLSKVPPEVLEEIANAYEYWYSKRDVVEQFQSDGKDEYELDVIINAYDMGTKPDSKHGMVKVYKVKEPITVAVLKGPKTVVLFAETQ